MIPLTAADLARIVGAKQNTAEYVEIAGFASDSREVKPGDLFLAIRGENVDGHDYAAKAIAQGAAATLCERPVDGPYILVDNLVQALACLARHYRDHFQGPVVGVTGSAGKTTTKEFVAAALSPLGPVLKNEGNRNTEYTAPLAWTELTPEHRAAVVEMGMRGFGQVAHLASFSRPTIGLVTNIGYSHIEMVGSREGIARAKGELLEALPSDGWAALWQEDDYIELLRERAPNERVRTFGFSFNADSLITSYQPTSWSSCRVDGVCLGEPWRTELPAAGRHMALDAASAVLAARLAGVPAEEAAEAMRAAVLPPLRMETLELNGATVLLDCYNAAPPSMAAAIETLAEMPVRGRRRAVIGEMRELGVASDEAHRVIGRELARRGIDEVIFIGDPMRLAHEAAAKPQYEVARSMDDVTRFLQRSAEGDAVLIKGSRSLELERALEPLGAEVRH